MGRVGSGGELWREKAIHELAVSGALTGVVREGHGDRNNIFTLAATTHLRTVVFDLKEVVPEAKERNGEETGQLALVYRNGTVQCEFTASAGRLILKNMSQRSPPRKVNDEKSTVEKTPSPKGSIKSERYRPKEKELCQAVLCIKQHLPMRSLEQTIIRLHHMLNENRKELTSEQMEDEEVQEGEKGGDNYISLEN